MLTVQIPNGRQYDFHHAVFDYNGTLAEEGKVTPAVKKLLRELSKKVHVAILTADTFGMARQELADLPEVELILLKPDQDGTEKAHRVQEWGAENTIAVGNGVNDQPMFFIAGLKIAVLGPEGVSSSVMAAANIIVRSPEDAIRLLLNPNRLIATLRA